MSAGDLTAYVDAVRTLWPEGPEPRLARRGESSPGRPRWLVVPNAEHPRMLVPDHPAAASSALLRFSSALGAGERLRRIAMSGVVRASGGAALRSRLEAGSANGSVLTALGESMGTELRCSLTLGSARANRKPVLQLFDERGTSVAFAKVGLTEHARADVRTEHDNLLTLAEHRLSDVVEVPRALGFHEWHGHPVLSMTPLPTPAHERRLTRPTELFEVMERFARRFDGGTVTLPEVPLWGSLSGRLDEISDDDTRDQLRTAMTRLADQAASTPVPVGAWHGDWAPWNMSRSRGRIRLWDWERFATGVPVGFDRCHFGLNAAFADHGVNAASARLGVALGGFTDGAPGTADHAVVGLYLVGILHRYLRGADALPRQVQERVEVLGELLQSWLRMP